MWVLSNIDISTLDCKCIIKSQIIKVVKNSPEQLKDDA